MDPKRAAIEQLYKKGTSLGRSWEQSRRFSKKQEWTESAMVKALEQECQGSDSASLPPQRFMTLAGYRTLSTSVSPL